MSTAYEIGTNALIEPGLEVYSRSVRDARDETPIGGIVVASVVRQSEGGPQDFYRVLDPYRAGIVFHDIASADVDRDAVVIPSSSRLTNMVRRLCIAVAYASPGHVRKGLMTPDQAGLVDVAHRLTGIVMGGSR